MVSDANLSLQAATTRTSSGAGPAFDLGAVRAPRDLAAHIIVTALSGAATFTVEHSHDGVSYATAGTVTGGTCYAPGEYVLPFTARRRYARLAVAVSGGSPSVTYAAELAPVRFGEAATRRLVDGVDAPAGPTVLFADDFETGTLAPAWHWQSGADYEDGAVAPAAAIGGSYGLLLSPAVPGGGTRRQLAALDYIDPSPAAPRALSLRWDWRLASFDPAVHTATAAFSWDVLGTANVTSTGVGDACRLTCPSLTPDTSDDFTGLADGQPHRCELLLDAPDGVARARLYLDGTPVATLSDTSGVTFDDFSSVGFQGFVSASCDASAGAPPAMHVDNVSVADGAQGV